MSATITPGDNLPAITSGRFSYGTNGLQFNNLSRIPPDRLKQMFKPKRGQAKTDTKGYKLSKKDIEAQLQLYGVDCSGLGSMRVGEMRDTLAEVVEKGECNSPTDEMIKLEASLKDKYSAVNTVHITSLAQTRQAEFDAITDPTSAANFSIPLFLRRYFLNDDGSPNRTKTPDPIALPGLGYRGTIHEAASEIEGLNTYSDGREPNRVLAIGWDRRATLSAASKAAAKFYPESKIKLDKERNKRMKEHRDFLKSLESLRKQRTTNSGGKAGKEFDLSRVAGRYLVECKDIEEGWPDESGDGLYMTIVPDRENKGRMVADFEFAILEGIMRFSQVGEQHLPDEGGLDSEEDDDSTEVDSHEEGGEEEEEEDKLATSFMPDLEKDDIDNELIYNSNNRKRKRKSSPPPTATATISKSTPKSTKSQPTKRAVASTLQIKRPRVSPTEKLKLLFLWRGRETGEGVIEVDYNRSNKGYIEFENADCTTFTGIFDSPFTTKAELKGYKVAKDDGMGINCSWEQFSEEVYEYDRVARWR